MTAFILKNIQLTSAFNLIITCLIYVPSLNNLLWLQLNLSGNKMREAGISCMPISNKSSSKPVFVSGLLAKPLLLYCRLKKSSWAKTSMRTNTGCFQTHFQGSSRPPKRLQHATKVFCKVWILLGFFPPH